MKRSSRWLSCALGTLLALQVGAARAEEAKPRELEGVGVTEHKGQPIALDATFRDHAGRPVRLGDIAGRGRPTLLTLNYFTCPMLCSLQLRGLINGLRGVEWTPGEDYDLVTVSFDPDETQANAARARDGYLKELRRLGAEWHFLTGTPDQIHKLLESVGMHIKKDEKGQWAHPAVAVLLAPDGRITQYLYG
ncbi:MAG: SCO family protein, partial [Deltaproteobacteria bacterium]